jgi:vesicle-associated membrane protein 7
MASSSSSTQLL